jgi:hypothetical protein
MCCFLIRGESEEPGNVLFLNFFFLSVTLLYGKASDSYRLITLPFSDVFLNIIFMTAVFRTLVIFLFIKLQTHFICMYFYDPSPHKFHIYRVYTKEWRGLPLFTIETAPFFCVYSVYVYQRVC